MTVTAGRVGDVLTAGFTMTAAADLERRTLAGTLVPYGVIGNTSWGPTRVRAGAVDVPARVVLLTSHDQDRPIGLLAEHDDTGDRMTGAFRVAATPAGDTALLEASEGIRNGFSVGIKVDAYEIDTEGDFVEITRATLVEVSHVTFPAFDGARIERVAASQTPDAAPAPVTTPERNTIVDESTAPAVAQATDSPTPAPVIQAAALPLARVQDPFPYRPGVQASFFRDMLNAGNDPDARGRFDQAQAMMTAAGVSTDVAEVIPEIYRPDLYVGQLANMRTVVDAFSKYSIDGPNPFRVPKWETASGLISDHTEGTNPTDGTVAFDEQVITPVAKSGQYTASREMIEGSNPAVDQIIMNAIREEYALDTEAYAITTFLAGATAGTVVDISDGVTMQIRARMITFQGNRKRGAEVFLAGSDLYGALSAQVDGSGRPMNPNHNPQNAVGSAGAAMESLEVAGRVTPYVPVLTGGLLGVKADAATFESGLRFWRWEEVAGPTNIKFAAFGYVVCAVFRATGLLKFATQA